MAYLRRTVEGVAILALAVACASEPVREQLARRKATEQLLQWGPYADKTVPDGFDYPASIRCAALATVRGDLQDASYKPFRYREWRLFRSWAEIRAKQAGQDPNEAAGDIDALAARLHAGLGEGDPKAKLVMLGHGHEGDLNACNSATEKLSPETVIF
jgi:hypothetical protein